MCCADRCLELSRIPQFTTVIPPAAASLGYALSLDGRSVDALPLVEEAARGLASRWTPIILPEQPFVRLGTVCLLADRIDDAIGWARKALEACQRHGARGSEADALRLLGQIAAQQKPPEVEEAESRYRDALALADQPGMRPLVAHCHLGLGQLYRKTDRREPARQHLATAISMYREMDMRFWPEQVEAELRELA